MSLKFKLIIILSLLSLILGAGAWHEMRAVYQVEKKVDLFVPATGYLLGIAEVNVGLARQAKEAFDYLVTGDARDRQEFSQLTDEVKRGFDLWINSAEKQKRLGVSGEVEDIGEGIKIRNAYDRWVGHVLGSFDLIDQGQRSLALKQYEHGSWTLLEKQVFSSIDAAMKDGFEEVEDAYHQLLLALGNRLFGEGDHSEILQTAHAAVHNVLSGSRVNSTISRQFSALATYLLTGNQKSLERFEELEVEARNAIDDWFMAAYKQSTGTESELSITAPEIRKLAESLEKLLTLEEQAIKAKQVGMPQRALLMMHQSSLENPLGEHLPLMVFSALKNGSQELVKLTSSSGRQGALLFVGIFLLVVLTALHMSQQTLVSLQILKDGMDAVRQGELQKKIALDGADEFGQLAEHFNQMSTSLLQSQQENEALHAELEQRVELRTRELAKANQELEAFNSAVSHDLRSPLSMINGYAELLLSEDQSPEMKQQSLQAILTAGEQIENIIGTLMDLSRMGAVELERIEVNLSALVESILQRYQQREPQRKVQLSLEQGLTVEADFDLLMIVMENLLSNAWKYTGTTEQTSIELGRCRGDRPRFYLRDNGAGFDMQQADRLFKPFQRLHSKHEFDGTGVGLATVQRIIQCHGGEISAEAEVGAGATFYFSFG